MLDLLPDWSLNFVPIILVAIWALTVGRWPWQKENVWGWVAVATMVISPIFSRLFTLADDQATAFVLWHFGLWLVLVMYSTIMAALTQKYSLIVVSVLSGLALIVLYNSGWHQEGINRHYITFVLMVTIAAVVFSIFLKFTKDQLFERLAWAIRVIGETFALVEFVLCRGLALDEARRLSESWGVDSSKYVCGRVFGDLWPHMSLAVTTAFMIWIVMRYAKLDRGT